MGQYSRDWMVKADCRSEDPEKIRLWDTDYRKGPQKRRARELCADCPVHIFCARYALSQEDPPTGVIIAGIVMPEDPNSELHAQAMEQIRKVAGWS